MERRAERRQELVEALRAATRRRSPGWSSELNPALMRLALAHVPSRAVAEEVVQDTWIGVINGIDRFEGRSALRTWIFQILLNKARTRGKREKRTLPFASLRRRGEEGRDEPAVDADRFQGRRSDTPGAWARPPVEWASPEETARVRRGPRGAARGDRGAAAAPARGAHAPRHPGLHAPRRRVTRSTSGRRTSECCCTGGARRSAPRSSGTSSRRTADERRCPPDDMPGVRRVGHRPDRGSARRGDPRARWRCTSGSAGAAPPTSSRSG